MESVLESSSPKIFLTNVSYDEWGSQDSVNDIKSSNICITGVPEKEQRKNGADIYFEEIMAENFLK